MAKRRTSSARSRAGKRAYKKRQRREAVKEFGGAAVSFIPGLGLAKTVHDMSKAYNKFRRN